MGSKTPVSILQELMVKKNLIPEYDLLPSIGVGTHNPTFHYQVTAGDVIACGKARSKKDAKHEAAKKALEKFTELGLYFPNQTMTPQESPIKEPNAVSEIIHINAVGQLKDFAAENNIPQPEFNLISDIGPAHDRRFTYTCTVGKLTTTSTDTTIKKAKQAAAKQMFLRLYDSLGDFANLDEDIVNVETAVDVVDPKDVENLYKSTSSTYNKKKINYGLKFSQYDQTIKKIMEEKQITYDDLWKDIYTENSTEELEILLGRLDLNYSIKTMVNEEQVVIFLSINSSPEFALAEIGNDNTIVNKVLRKAFAFLRIMSK